MTGRSHAADASWLDRVCEDRAVWDSLSARVDFASAAEWFDTTLVIESGGRAMYVKVYRGRIIDTGRGHGFQGYAFALSAEEATWSEVLRRGSKAFHRALTAGDVRTRGNLIEFNRAIKMVSLLVDHLSTSATGRSA